MDKKLLNILPPIVDKSTRILIVGSMPGKQSLEKQQYYGNPRNHFWTIMTNILKISSIPENYEERIQMLRDHRIGLWDVIQTCEREGSLDANIRNEQPNDFHKLFTAFPHIRLVLFNGGKAYDVFKKHVGLELLDGRSFEKMPSTSPIPGKNIKTLEEKIATWCILKDYIVDN